MQQCCSSPDFKQQALDYALSNSHEPIAAIAQKSGVGYSSLDKGISETNPTGSSKRQLEPEEQRSLELKKEVKQLKETNGILKKARVYFLTDHAKKSTR